MDLLKAEAAAKGVVKEAQAAVDEATLKRYGGLTEGDIKSLALDDKWVVTIRDRIADAADSLTLKLVGRIQELGERYAESVGVLGAELKEIEMSIADHLNSMGVEL